MPESRHVFITGGTGYVGSRLIPLLLNRGHRVTALAREQSSHKLPAGCEIAIGDALDAASYRHLLNGADTFIQLVGVAHPGPAKSRQFIEVDLKSGIEAVKVARAGSIGHFVYVSVAHPAPVMQAYIDARVLVEQALCGSCLNASILRPWYVLGPGHRWPYLLIPFYKLAEKKASTRDAANRLGLVKLGQMLSALAYVVEHPPDGTRIFEVPQIRRPTGPPSSHSCESTRPRRLPQPQS